MNRINARIVSYLHIYLLTFIEFCCMAYIDGQQMIVVLQCMEKRIFMYMAGGRGVDAIF